jgi:Predicted GTPase
MTQVAPRRVVIMGAAGRDFHDFNVVFRDDSGVVVVAFTATQIPGIAGRRYPAELAGIRYPAGIPIVPEAELEEVVRREHVDEVVFAYSDVAHATVMHQASRVLAAGADFVLLGPESTMVTAAVPVISVCAVRTGAGKSQISRFVAGLLQERGRRPVIVRHPMPYGDLVKQRVQRFASPDDLDRFQTTIEEREDYEPHIRQGRVVYAGVDYGAIVAQAQQEADILVWDGGNNDFPFIRSDLEIVVVDPFRPGDELTYHPGETNLRRAAVVVVNKVGSAPDENVRRVIETAHSINPGAVVVQMKSAISVEGAGDLRGRSVLVVEDGPTLTHGGMSTGAGVEAARTSGAAQLVDPRPWAVGSIAEVYRAYPHLGPLLPAVGYFEEQLRDLEATIAATPADVVVIATPFDLTRVIRIDKPVVRVRYESEELGEPSLTTVVTRFLSRLEDASCTA